MRHTLLAAVVMAASCVTAVSAEEALLFEETFGNCRSTTAQGGYFTESLYFDPATMGDNDGWEIADCYEAERCIKFSAKTKHGTAVTPWINLAEGEDGYIKVYFRAQSWISDNVLLNVCIDGYPETMQTVDVDGTDMITDRSKDGFVLSFSDVPSAFRLSFTTTPKEAGGVRRLFLGDVSVTQDTDGSEPWLQGSASYHLFDDLMCSNGSETRSVRVTPRGGAGQPTVIVPEDSEFRLASQYADGNATVFTFGFAPRNAGYKEEVFTITDGTVSRTLTLGGKGKVYRPESLPASGVEATSFTANWAPAPGMDEMELVVWRLEEGVLEAKDLMFSKYIEGKSNNRAVEIFNGTPYEVDLLGYYLMMEVNGAGGLTKCRFDFPEVSLESGQSYTVANAQFGTVRDIADKTIGFQDGGYENIMTFTGDDAIGLFSPAGTLIDLVGYESIDVNDRVNGVWGTDVTYYRRGDCYTPHPKFYVEEWDTYEMDYCEGFGQHIMFETGMVRDIVARIKVDGSAQSALVENLEPLTQYHYAVRGFSGIYETHYSGEQTLTTTEGSGIGQTVSAAGWNREGNVLTLAEGTEAFSVSGVRLAGSRIVLEGHGVVIVRQADGKTAKVAF